MNTEHWNGWSKLGVDCPHCPKESIYSIGCVEAGIDNALLCIWCGRVYAFLEGSKIQTDGNFAGGVKEIGKATNIDTVKGTFRFYLHGPIERGDRG